MKLLSSLFSSDREATALSGYSGLKGTLSPGEHLAGMY